jgi:hypothetical protein
MSSQPRSCSVPNKETPQYLHMIIGGVVILVLICVLQYVLSGSTLISLIFFNLIFLFLTFPLKGSLWCKIVWLVLGNVVGVSFGLIRLSFSLVLKADFYGIDFLLNHVIDFLWIVPIWSLALSSLCMTKNRKKSIGDL